MQHRLGIQSWRWCGWKWFFETSNLKSSCHFPSSRAAFECFFIFETRRDVHLDLFSWNYEMIKSKVSRKRYLLFRGRGKPVALTQRRSRFSLYARSIILHVHRIALVTIRTNSHTVFGNRKTFCFLRSRTNAYTVITYPIHFVCAYRVLNNTFVEC